MGMRFHKSVKLTKGVKLNFSNIYSIAFDRTNFNENKSKASTGKEFCLLFKNRCNILSNGSMKVIVPYEIEDIL